MHTKSVSAEITKSDNSDFDAKFILSAASPDRVRDTIDPDTYDNVSKSVKKLIALFNHNPNNPVGFWQNLKREKDTLTGYIKLASTNFGLMIKQLLVDEVPLGASIGFRGSGEPNELGGIHFTSLELIETSIVSTPAHPRAIQIAKQYGIELPINDNDPAAASGETKPKQIKRATAAVMAAKRSLKGSK